MHNRLAENTIEEFTIKLLEHLGYQYIYAPNCNYFQSIFSDTILSWEQNGQAKGLFA